ncbi:MAG: GTP cyclohydrolase I [Ruminococcus sp.]|nr:GTP cyclohydrolase I [Bacteroidales bacterium]MCC8112329.1 GTP cyclohydrolase I [Ruminococcus sp.]
MKVYLAGEGYKREFLINKLEKGEDVRSVNVLEAFYYLRKQPQFWPYIHSFGSFMLDSGIFTYLAGTHKGKTDWDKYVEQYADFINTHHIDLFVEVDIESIVGMKEMERLRAKLERLTSKQPIPVWHLCRGKVARVVGYCAAKMQLQERLAKEIVDVLAGALNDDILGMAIVMKGTHLCKTMRGVRNNGQMTVSHLTGEFRTNPEVRAEFLKLIDLDNG